MLNDFHQLKNNNNFLEVNATHILLCGGSKGQCNQCKQVNKPLKRSRSICGFKPRVLSGMSSLQPPRYTTATFSFMLQMESILMLLNLSGEDYSDLLIAFLSF